MSVRTTVSQRLENDGGGGTVGRQWRHFRIGSPGCRQRSIKGTSRDRGERKQTGMRAGFTLGCLDKVELFVARGAPKDARRIGRVWVDTSGWHGGEKLHVFSTVAKSFQHAGGLIFGLTQGGELATDHVVVVPLSVATLRAHAGLAAEQKAVPCRVGSRGRRSRGSRWVRPCHQG